jgi:hypothetical protein
VSDSDLLDRRSFLLAAAGAADGLAGCSGSGPSGSSQAGTIGNATPTAAAIDCPAATGTRTLWQTAMQRGIVYGSSAATWQLSDPQYRKLFEREPAIRSRSAP